MKHLKKKKRLLPPMRIYNMNRAQNNDRYRFHIFIYKFPANLFKKYETELQNRHALWNATTIPLRDSTRRFLIVRNF